MRPPTAFGAYFLGSPSAEVGAFVADGLCSSCAGKKPSLTFRIIMMLTLYISDFTKSVRSYTLHVTTLDLATGHVIASVNISATIANTLTDFLLLGPSQVAPSDANTDGFGPSLVWLSPSSAASRWRVWVRACMSDSDRHRETTRPVS